jgi:hypothetical protein
MRHAFGLGERGLPGAQVVASGSAVPSPRNAGDDGAPTPV